MENKKEDIPIHDTKNVDTSIDLPENEATTLNEQNTNTKKGKILTEKNEALENPPSFVHRYTPSQEKV
jgi:hypothetical protein